MLMKNSKDQMKMMRRMSSSMLFGMSSMEQGSEKKQIRRAPPSMLSVARRNSQPMMNKMNF